MRTIINQALTQKAQDLLLELNSEVVVAKRLKAIIASLRNCRKFKFLNFLTNQPQFQIKLKFKILLPIFF